MLNNQSVGHRRFTPEQKLAILKDIECSGTIKEGLERHNIHPSLYYKWKRQLAVAVKSGLRNSKPAKDPRLKALELENKQLKEVVLQLTYDICALKKTWN